MQLNKYAYIKKNSEKRAVLKLLVTLSIPTILEQIMTTLLQYVDTAMVGHLGEQATAAVSVTTTVTWLVNSTASAIGVSVLAMIAKAAGSKNQERVQKLAGQSFLSVLICGIIIGAGSVLLSPFIPVWMGAEAAVQDNASRYFFIISVPMVFRASSTILGAAIRATQNTRTPMIISMCANGINVILNVVLIYGCGLGVTGAALASAISYTVSGLCMFWAFCRNQQLSFQRRYCRVDREILREAAGISLPVLGTSMISCLGYIFFAGMVSGMGTTIFAAHSIAVTAETIFYIPGYGLRTAVSALIGNSLGERNQKKFENTRNLSVTITLLLMVISGIVLYFVAYPLMCLFTNSEAVAELGAKMLRLVAFSEPFFGLTIVLEGIFYGLGRTRYVFFAESGSMWGIRILFTFFCVQLWHLDLQAVWICMIADNICKAVLVAIPFLRNHGQNVSINKIGS